MKLIKKLQHICFTADVSRMADMRSNSQLM